VAERAVSRSFTDAFVRTILPEPTWANAAGADAPEWRAQSALARAESLDELGHALAGPGTVVNNQAVSGWLRRLGDRRVLLYFQAGDLYYLGRLSPRGVELRPLETRRVVEERVDTWLRAPQDEAAAAALGALLLPAWIGDAGDAPVERWTVVPDGALGRVSFAALVRDGQRLVSSVTLGYAPSLETLFRPAATSPRHHRDVLVLGDPKGDLPEARAELSAVAARLGVAPRLDAEATRQALRAAGGARLLHLASHAGLDEAGPWLDLADGPLRPSWLLGGKVAPEHVVLASCDSAGARGRGLAGSLPAAFLAAGSRSVVAALGSVEDAVARRFVLRFYQEGGAEDPAGALARAQRAFAAQGSPVSEWAPFVVLETF
jgi:CHAT domain-containing protein